MSIDPERLGALVQGLVDRQAIVDLMTGYASGIDLQEWERWEGLFAADAVIDYPSARYEGRAGLAAWLSARMRAFLSTQHLVGSSLVEISGDTATSFSYMQAVHVPDPARPGRHYDTGGWYRNEYVRTPAGWRIQRLRLTLVWTLGDRAPDPGSGKGATP